jgi:hypothetical protein
LSREQNITIHEGREQKAKPRRGIEKVRIDKEKERKERERERKKAKGEKKKEKGERERGRANLLFHREFLV